MEEIKKLFKIFFYLIGIIVAMVTNFYFTHHNSLKEHIILKSEHLKENINQVGDKVNDFKQETKENFNKIESKLDKLTEKITNMKK